MICMVFFLSHTSLALALKKRRLCLCWCKTNILYIYGIYSTWFRFPIPKVFNPDIFSKKTQFPRLCFQPILLKYFMIYLYKQHCILNENSNDAPTRFMILTIRSTLSLGQQAFQTNSANIKEAFVLMNPYCGYQSLRWLANMITQEEPNKWNISRSDWHIKRKKN